MFNITGTLKVKSAEQQVSEKFKKREFVLTDNSSQYPQHITFQLTQDKCGLIDSYNVGDQIKVSFNLRGREWTKNGETRYFNTLEAWRLERASQGNDSAPMTERDIPPFETFSSDKEDLPF